MNFPRFGEYDLLDLLVDGPSSFAALYNSANKLCVLPNGDGLTVEEIWDTATSVESSGYVRLKIMRPDGSLEPLSRGEREEALQKYLHWLPVTTGEETSVDEVGIWIEINAVGKERWQEIGSARENREYWTIDQDAKSGTIIVHAPDVEIARFALGRWLDLHPNIEVFENRMSIEPIDGFSLHDGTKIDGGITLRTKYRVT